MTDIDEQESETKELLNKIGRYNKNIKALMELMGQVSEKLNKVLDMNGSENSNNDEKERVGKILEKKGVGRPCGDFNSKREQYLKMLNENKIQQPKPATMEYYRIEKVGDKYVTMG